jgi:large subunit ribosomal protein L31
VKPGIHPEYRPVVFRDAAAGVDYLIGSTVRTELTTTTDDGVTYPLVTLDISAASHPFYTGKMRIVDSAGRVERFEKRYGRRSPRP